jgi:hypothetical protein
MVPFEGETSTGVTVKNGVISVSIDQNFVGSDRYTAEDALESAAANLVGNLNQFDYVMLCLPPGTDGGWIAYAYVGVSNL